MTLVWYHINMLAFASIFRLSRRGASRYRQLFLSRRSWRPSGELINIVATSLPESSSGDFVRFITSLGLGQSAFIESCLSNLACNVNSIICLGDFNITMLDPSDCHARHLRNVMSLSAYRRTHVWLWNRQWFSILFWFRLALTSWSDVSDATSISDHFATRVCHAECGRFFASWPCITVARYSSDSV